MWTIWHRYSWHSSQTGVKRPRLWFTKEETKAMGRKKIKVLNKTSFSYQIEVLFSFQKTFKILVSIKNHIFRTIFWKKKQHSIKEASVFSSLLFVWLLDFLYLFLSSYTFSVTKEKDSERKRENAKQAQRNVDCFFINAGDIFWINKLFMLYIKAFKTETFLKIIFLSTAPHKPCNNTLSHTKHFWHFKIVQTALE